MNQRKKFARQIALIIFLSGCILSKSGAQSSAGYGIKLQAIRGSVYPHDKQIKKIIDQPVSGAELSVEYQTLGEKPWQQYNNFPVVGVGAVWLNLGNPSQLGHAFALYPYINYRLLDTKFFKLRVKAGMGASYLTKTYYNTNADNYQSLQSGNAAIGSNLNVYFSGGGSLEIPIYNGLSLTADYTWNHMSNGSVVVPNSGLNLLNAFAGIKYTPNYKAFNRPEKAEHPDLNRNFKWECILSGGVRQLFYRDKKNFPIGSISIAAYKPLSNFYQMGLGVDGFYDGAYDGNTKFERSYITSDQLQNKLRAGISWRHELLLGKITAGLQFGIYLYDPLKNLEPKDLVVSNGGLPLNKPLIYTYDIDKEDGWLYTRAVFKYAVTDHLLLSVGLKTHLQKAEFIEWGVGYKL